MKMFVIDNAGKISAVQPESVTEGQTTFTSDKELAVVTSEWPSGKLVESIDRRISMSGFCLRSFSHLYHSLGDDAKVAGKCWVAGCCRSSKRRPTRSTW